MGPQVFSHKDLRKIQLDLGACVFPLLAVINQRKCSRIFFIYNNIVIYFLFRSMFLTIFYTVFMMFSPNLILRNAGLL